MPIWNNQKYWSLKKYEPRDDQIKIIDEIADAIDMGFKNIILEAGTGIGKSAIATTIANMVNDTYICTMTTQLQSQYIDDFKDMLKEIKGRSKYHCNYNDTCENCYIKYVNEHNLINEKIAILSETDFDLDYVESLDEQSRREFLSGINIFPCKDCKYLTALKEAISSPNVITNYDFLYNAGYYAGLFQPRKLLILDESHNFEKKMLNLISDSISRKSLYRNYDFDIFYPITKGEKLKNIESKKYWIGIFHKIIDKIKNEKQKQIFKLLSTGLDHDKLDSYLTAYDNQISRFTRLINYLESEKWIIELPTKKEILEDYEFKKNLTVEFKPVSVKEYSSNLLNLGEIRLFLTGTLGSKDKFCEWIGIDPNETYYRYEKSPFPKQHRPIIKSYVGNMAGKTKGKYNWELLFNPAIDKIKKIISKHSDEKGVIHTANNKQSFMIKKALDNYIKCYVAQGRDRNTWIKKFEDSIGPTILIGAGIKDGVDFKGDKCRYQILFKMPNIYVGSKQVQIRKHYDNSWYTYQTIMPLMQAYGRGIRDMDDYCTTYVLDSDFERLLNNYNYLFNEYFLEAIVKPKIKPIPIGGK